MTEPARVVDVRVGSATDGRVPVSMVERSLSARAFHWASLLSVATSAFAADQLTKGIVLSQLALGEGVHVAGPLWIRHVPNPGIAFGLFSTWARLVTLLTGLAICWMLVYFARAGARHPILPVALGFLVGGSLGNFADRIRIGHVTDFIDLRFWPAFNLADAFIVVGVAILLAALVAAERQPRLHRTAPKTG